MSIKMATSVTLVFVGPVIIRSFRFLKKLYASLFSRYDSGFKAFSKAFSTVLPSTMAPAASVGPSIPSVPQETIEIAFRSWISLLAARVSSWFLPPNPLPFTVTVVSPPKIRA